MGKPAGLLLMAAAMLPVGGMPSQAQTHPCAAGEPGSFLPGASCPVLVPAPGLGGIGMPVPDQGGDEGGPVPWRGLRMGMSVAEVLRLVPGAYPREEAARAGDSRTRLVKENVRFAGLTLMARYFFVDDRFDRVAYAPPGVFGPMQQVEKDFEAVYSLLKAEYGEPTHSGEVDGLAPGDGPAHRHAVWGRAGGHSIVLALMPTGMPGVAAMSFGYRTPLKDPDPFRRLDALMNMDGQAGVDGSEDQD
ncbi:MAG: hypothetical protein Q4B17_10895 [Lautropia sp.]|nr:hypothetical protein [Lautropia sp.]